LDDLFRGEFKDSTSFNIDFDDASGVWIDGNPSQTNSATRKLEREAAHLTGFDPITSQFGIFLRLNSRSPTRGAPAHPAAPAILSRQTKRRML
jgi:hypothetical protein